jgi:hypothetical protein
MRARTVHGFEIFVKACAVRTSHRRCVFGAIGRNEKFAERGGAVAGIRLCSGLPCDADTGERVRKALNTKPERAGFHAELYRRTVEHDPEKWTPVFGKDHAPSKS